MKQKQWQEYGYPSALAFDLMCAMQVNDATPPECWDKEDYEKAAAELISKGYAKVNMKGGDNR